MVTTCPTCGQPISRKQLDRIEARVRREERERAREAEGRALQRLEHRHEEAVESLRVRLGNRYEAEIAALQGRLRRRDLRDQRQIDVAVQRAAGEFARERSALRGKIQELERRLEAKPVHERGDGTERDLLDVLRGRFGADAVERTARGEAGGDLRQTVRDRAHECGTILYEVKNHRTWQKAFLTKLKNDAAREDATHAVLVSASFPAGECDLCVRDGIVIVHPRLVVYVAHVLRESMVALHRQGLSQRERAGKLEALYAYLGGGGFARHVERAAGATKELTEIDRGERDAHERTWKRRTDLVQRLDRTLAELGGEVNGVLEQRTPSRVQLVAAPRPA